jgi:MFS superfamily sulfate permease-like transporter
METPGLYANAESGFAPGLPALLGYRRGDLAHDLIAGLSVAAVALPVGVAYAQLAGFNPVVGLYVSILPLVAYALFGTSRQLVVGPDAATCDMTLRAMRFSRARCRWQTAAVSRLFVHAGFIQADLARSPRRR